MRLTSVLRLSLGAISALFFLAARSLAAELTWQAPPGCPDRDAVKWRVEEALNSGLESAAPLRFSAEVEKRANGRWFVVINVSGTSDESQAQRRQIEAASCDELVKATSVAIALALGASGARDGHNTSVIADGSPPEAEKAPPNAAASVALIRADVTPKAKESRQEYRLTAHLGALIDHGSLPGLAPGVQIAAMGSWRSFGLKLSGFAFPESVKSTDAGPGGAFSLMAGSLALCGLVPPNPSSLQFCAGSEFGVMRGQALNATLARTGTSGWLAPFAELEVSLGLAQSLRLFASAALVLPLIRKDFEILSQGVPEAIYQPGAVAERLGLGVKMLWP